MNITLFIIINKIILSYTLYVEDSAAIAQLGRATHL
ncbi:hypothetical protein KEN51_CDS0059 [Pseudomonas phage vB_Pae10145-KEN51]|nr:hypothetical protein [Pseudomonas phage PhiPizzaParty]WRQ05917.1 hypothetical protein IPCDMZAV_CDS0395 [Pseudomonas phage 6B]WRQ06004.1 hypothetical protein QAMIJHJT_CDS0073 [Pseudomonas phage 9-Ps-8B]WRQ06412.1 hypothetical protein FOPPYZMZ_CDS0072 [Pseudomonas phage 9Ps-7B]WRQ06763.1 hypothetical protein ZBUARNPM_CDS0014 [Pseudomonas phage 14Ps5-6]